MTDHQSLTWLQGLKEPKGRLARWILALQEYEFKIKHRPGRQHSNADTLSQFPRVTPSLVPDEAADDDLMVGVKATEVCSAWSRAEILKAQQADASISTILQQLSGDAIFPFVNGRCQHEQSLPTLYPFVSLCVPDINYTRDAVHPRRGGTLSLARPSGSRFS